MQTDLTRTWLDPVQQVLDGLQRPVDFFFRDDDVGWGDDRLWPLLDLFAEHALPADLAVIPAELTQRLAHRLHASAACSPGELGFHQHGFAHVNHELDGRKYEFGPSRPGRLQRHDIAEGRTLLTDLLGPSIEPIFTPPWNRCTPETGRCLAELGFAVLSREARADPLAIPGLVELPVNVDWFAHRKRVRLSRAEFADLVAATVRRGRPVGVMFHHAIMDADERAAAGAFLALVARHPMASPGPMRALAGASPGSSRGSPW
jgi:peptidoglycan/xylan/chitin deacetylase (PgdA/CDA1 family)